MADLRGLGRAIMWGFGSGVGRKLAFVLVALVLAWCGVGKAHAAATPGPTCNASGQVVGVGGTYYCSRQEAYERCQNSRSIYTSASWPATVCRFETNPNLNGNPPSYNCWVNGGGTLCSLNGARGYHPYPAAYECPAGMEWNDTTHTCVDEPDCEAGAKIGGGAGAPGSNGQAGCVYDPTAEQYCEVVYSLAGSDFPGFPQGYMVGGETCDPNTYSCPPGWFKDTNGLCSEMPECPEGVAFDADLGMCEPQNECPSGQEKNINGQCQPVPDCPAGKIKAPDGSCIDDPDNCPSGFVKGPDGTCKHDDNGDGEPDAPADDNVTGGDMCDTPPLCQGDSGTCFQAKKLWRIDCNTRKGQASWGLDHYCQTPPVCNAVVGSWQPDRTQPCDPAEEAAMLLRWQQVCELRKIVGALEKANSGTPGQPGTCPNGDCDQDGQPDWTENPGNSEQPPGEDDGEGNGAIGSEREITLTGPGGTLDSVGLGYTRSCPNMPAVVIYGATLELNNGPLCDWLALGGQLVLIMAALASLKILSGGASI